MAFLIRKIEIIAENVSALGGKREINKILERSYAVAGAWWHSYVRPEKFTAKGARRGHFAARKTKNIFAGTINMRYRGLFRAPSPLPLVWTGRSRALSRSGTIRASSKGAKITYPIRQFNQPGKPAINKVEEFRITARADKRKMQTAANTQARDEVRKFRRKTKITINVP